MTWVSMGDKCRLLKCDYIFYIFQKKKTGLFVDYEKMDREKGDTNHGNYPAWNFLGN